MSVRGAINVLDSKLGLHRGKERHFTHVGWWGIHGRISTMALCYGFSAFLLYTLNVPYHTLFGMAIPFAFGIYFGWRPPLSFISVAALSACIISIFVVSSQYERDWAETPSEDHTSEDHADDGGSGAQDGVIGGGAGTPVR